MDETQQELVRASSAKVVPIADVAAAMFYDRLFAIDPDLRPLFKHDIKKQGEMLMAVFSTAVAHPDRLDEIMPTARALGRRHAGHGIKDSDYDTVAAALLATLEPALGDEFTPAVRNAWGACYSALAGEMKAAAAQANLRPYGRGGLDFKRPPSQVLSADEREAASAHLRALAGHGSRARRPLLAAVTGQTKLDKGRSAITQCHKRTAWPSIAAIVSGPPDWDR